MTGQKPRQVRIGTAGWAIPRAVADRFPAEGSSLARYAARFDAAEINSTFYRSHRPQTYARWADTTPPGFRFAVKLPRTITHDARLIDCGVLLEAFVAEAGLLAQKLGPYLIQLPPSLAFDRAVADRFFAALRAVSANPAVCEPRHPSWFEGEAEPLFQTYRVARAAADPARHPAAATPGGWAGLTYWRLHGSPRPYYSSYEASVLHALAGRLSVGSANENWCIFDNTASGAAAANALELSRIIAEPDAPDIS